MEKKAFLVTFKASVVLTGTVQIENDGVDGILRKAKEIVERNVNVDNCLIELGTENGNDDLVTVKEIGTERGVSISNIVELN